MRQWEAQLLIGLASLGILLGFLFRPEVMPELMLSAIYMVSLTISGGVWRIVKDNEKRHKESEARTDIEFEYYMKRECDK